MNDEDKTCKAFIRHPDLGYIYKTGDYGVLHREGYIEFLGRKDYQVKIKGYRIELGEIENEILRHNQVKEAIVIDRTDANGLKHLYAYIVADKKLKAVALKEFLAQTLPNYMLPAYYVFLDKLPLTANGKLDRKNLPDADISLHEDDTYVAPNNKTEEWVISLWKDILKISKVGIMDNFFDVGGDSLTATRLITMIKSIFNVEMPLNVVFRNGTVKGIVDYIKTQNKGRDVSSVSNVILLREGINPDKNMFFIHAGSGEIEVYVELCNGLRDDFYFWAIQQEKPSAWGPQNISIEDMAMCYLQKIKRIQPRGPYYLGGWCVGGTVSFEITRLLENDGETVGFLTLINSLAPQKKLLADERRFSIETEIDFFGQYFTSFGFQGAALSQKSNFAAIEDIWSLFRSYLKENDIKPEDFRKEIPKELARLIPNFGQLNIDELIYYTNLFRSSQLSRALYIPVGNINAQVFFYEASNEKVINKSRWNIYCNKILKQSCLDGDHVSILTAPNVYKTAEIIDADFNKEVH